MTPFAKGYIEQVESENLLEALNATLLETLRLYQGMDETIGNYRYAAGKWTLKEVLLHIIDTERIFAYRALTMARNDKSPLPGFEQDDYVPVSKAESRTLKSLVEEYEVVRKGSIILLENMDDEMLDSPISYFREAFSSEEEEDAGTSPGPDAVTMTVKALFAALLSTIL